MLNLGLKHAIALRMLTGTIFPCFTSQQELATRLNVIKSRDNKEILT